MPGAGAKRSRPAVHALPDNPSDVSGASGVSPRLASRKGAVDERAAAHPLPHGDPLRARRRLLVVVALSALKFSIPEVIPGAELLVFGWLGVALGRLAVGPAAGPGRPAKAGDRARRRARRVGRSGPNRKQKQNPSGSTRSSGRSSRSSRPRRRKATPSPNASMAPTRGSRSRRTQRPCAISFWR